MASVSLVCGLGAVSLRNQARTPAPRRPLARALYPAGLCSRRQARVSSRALLQEVVQAGLAGGRGSQRALRRQGGLERVRAG